MPGECKADEVNFNWTLHYWLDPTPYLNGLSRDVVFSKENYGGCTNVLLHAKRISESDYSLLHSGIENDNDDQDIDLRNHNATRDNE